MDDTRDESLDTRQPDVDAARNADHGDLAGRSTQTSEGGIDTGEVPLSDGSGGLEDAGGGPEESGPAI